MASYTTTRDRLHGGTVRRSDGAAAPSRGAARVSDGRRRGRRIAPGVHAAIGLLTVGGLMLVASPGDVRRECAPVTPSMVSAEQWRDMMASGQWSGDPRDGAEQLWPRDCLEFVETGVFLTGGR